ncbi:MAG: 3'-5' exoribonuclease [Bacteroidia bacterium]
MDSTYCVVDIEATGGNHKNGRIIEIGIVKIRNRTIVSEYATLVNPEQAMDKYVSKLTGITDDDLVDAPVFKEVAREIVEFLGNSFFVAHNASFDYTYLRAELRKLGIEYTADQYCTIDMSRILFAEEPSYSLGKLCRSLNVEVADRHRALGDALTTANLFLKLLKEESILEVLETTKRKGHNAMTEPTGKVNVGEEFLAELPDEPGIYYLKDKKGKSLYIGRGESIKNSAKKIFSPSKRYERFRLHSFKFNKIEYQLCGNELLAELLFYQEVFSKPPALNIHVKQLEYRYALSIFKKRNSYRVGITRVREKNAIHLAYFKDFKTAEKEIKKLAEKFKLSSKSYDLNLVRMSKTKSILTQKEVREEADNTVFVKILNQKRAYQPTGIFTGNGRKANEKVAFVLEKGKLLGYAYVDAEKDGKHLKENLTLDSGSLIPIDIKDGAKICWHFFMLTKQYFKIV